MAQSQRFGAACRLRFGAGLSIILSPLMRIAWLGDTDGPPVAGAVIFTSENGVQGFVRNWPDWRGQAWCVGARTAQAAQAAGLRTRTGPGTAEGLVSAIVATGGASAAPLVHFRGEHARGAVAQQLRAAGLQASERVIYRQAAQPLNAQACAALGWKGRLIVPLFSPRSARIFADEVARYGAGGGADLHLIAMSKAVAQALGGSDAAEMAAHIHLASHPDAGAMLDEISRILAPPGLLESGAIPR